MEGIVQIIQVGVIGVSVCALILSVIAAIKFKDPRQVLYMLLMTCIILATGYLYYGGKTTDVWSIWWLEMTTALGWFVFFVYAYDKTVLKKFWRRVVYALLCFGAISLVVFFLWFDEIDQLYRQLYVVPFAALSYLFATLRLVQKSQKGTLVYMFLWLYVTAATMYYVSADPFTYFTVKAAIFSAITLFFGILQLRKKTPEEGIFGVPGRVKIKISRRILTVMIGTFLVIFILSFFVLYVAIRGLFLYELNEGLTYQNTILSESLKNSVNRSITITDQQLSKLTTQSPQEIVKYFKVGGYDILGVKIQKNRETEEVFVDNFVRGEKKAESLIDSNTKITMYSDSANKNPIIKIEMDSVNEKIEVYIDGFKAFQNQEKSSQLSQASRIGLISENGEIITFPIESPYHQDNQELASSLNETCSQALQSCRDGQCESISKRYFIEKRDIRNDPIGNVTTPIPEFNICANTQIRQNEVFIEPSPEETLSFAGIGIILIAIFAIASGTFEKSITEPLEELQDSVEKMKKGELATKLTRQYDDEIGDLAQNFSQLIAQLNESRKNVEQKVVLRTAELQNEKEKIEVIVQSMNSGMLFITNENEVLLFNQAAENITGVPAKEIIGKKYDALLTFVSEEDADKKVQFIAKDDTEKTALKRARLTTKKREVPIQYSIAPVIFDNEKVGLVVVFQDITKQKELELMKSNFVSIASHQLKTPLSATRWALEILIDQKDKLSEEQQEFIEQAFESNKRMIDLVSELLKVSRLESGKITSNPEEFSITDTIDQVAKDQSIVAKSRGIEIVIKNKIKDEKVFADPILVGSALENFVSNAIEYSDPGRKNVITIITEEIEGKIKVSVKDKGIGIAKEDYGKVFSMFYRGENAAEVRADGTGLGLFIVKMMIELLGGSVGFTSEKGVGSTFYIMLPKKS